MKEIRLGLLGLDYDTEAGRGWPGARYAPNCIRNALGGIMNRMEEGLLFDVCHNCLIDYNQIEIRDYGNADRICRYSHEQALQEMSEAVQTIIRDGYTPLILGGDHSVTNAGFDALYNCTSGRVGIIDFDAHLDLKYDSPVQGRYSGSIPGMWLRLGLVALITRNIITIFEKVASLFLHLVTYMSRGQRRLPKGRLTLHQTEQMPFM